MQHLFGLSGCMLRRGYADLVGRDESEHDRKGHEPKLDIIFCMENRDLFYDWPNSYLLALLHYLVVSMYYNREL
jgi:hypothetical protein